VLVIEQAIYNNDQNLLNEIIKIFNKEVIQFNIGNQYPTNFDAPHPSIDLSIIDKDNIHNYLFE